MRALERWRSKALVQSPDKKVWTGASAWLDALLVKGLRWTGLPRRPGAVPTGCAQRMCRRCGPSALPRLWWCRTSCCAVSPDQTRSKNIWTRPATQEAALAATTALPTLSMLSMQNAQSLVPLSSHPRR